MATESVEEDTTNAAQPAGDRPGDSPRTLLPLLTSGMALSMLVLYAIGSLGPFIIDDLHISKSQLGLLTAVAFGTATVVSLYAGHLTDVIGGRRALVALLALIAVDFGLLAATRTYWFLLGALVLAGLPQALANPSTNKLIATHLPAERRAGAVGIKQSGVQLGAFAAGLLLPTLARALSWRGALALVVPVAVVAAALAAVLPRDASTGQARRLTLPGVPNTATRWLMAYSLCIGSGLAALNTYLPLYAHQRLGMGDQAAGALIAALGVSGIFARILWARFSDRLANLSASLAVLAIAAVCFAVLVPSASSAHWLIWIGAIGLGGSAVAANAVSMVAVVKGRGFGSTGHASALVSMGFFAGFVVGPLSFGFLVDTRGGYRVGWTMVAAVFAIAVLCAVGGRRSAAKAGA